MNHKIHKFYELNNYYKIGVHFLGEFRMGCEHGRIVILSKDNEEYIDFQDSRFAFYSFDNPFIIDVSENYIVLNWMIHHVHSHIVSMVIDIHNKGFMLIHPYRLLFAKSLHSIQNNVIIDCIETKWENSNQVRENVKIEFDKSNFKPIKDFYNLDITKIGLKIYRWENGRLSIGDN